ncbi:MAG TPA: hypothetical protein VMW48_05480, partial [Vicinamibacterales bacterium]|nr:hypothetical protein [Vicinamibacterales bacterium]
DMAHVVARAGARGVAVRRLADHYLGPPTSDGLVLGYGGIPAAKVDEGLTRLAAAFASVARQSPAAPQISDRHLGAGKAH